MRRALGYIMIAGLLMGAAACGSSGGSDSSKATTAPASASDSGSDSGSGSGGSTTSTNKDVQAYCKSIDALVQKYKDAKGDMTKLSTLSADGQDLAKKGAALTTSGLSAADGQAVADCTKKSTDALAAG